MNQTMLPKIAGVECLTDIQDNGIVAISGFNMATTPEYLIIELHKKYTDQGHFITHLFCCFSYSTVLPNVGKVPFSYTSHVLLQII